jgi:hypothetical protein
MNAEAERKPHDLVPPIHDLGGTNREGAPLLLWDQREIIADQANGGAQGFMLIMLLLEGVPQVTALHHLLCELVFKTCLSHYADRVRKAPQI